MSPRWLTIEKLVTDLGGVCSARHEVKGLIDAEPPGLDQCLTDATQAVTAALTVSARGLDDSTQVDDVVRKAWTAIAVAQDRVARLSEEVARSRALRDRAQGLQDHAFRLRVRDRRRTG
jgi:hypothetical protein